MIQTTNLVVSKNFFFAERILVSGNYPPHLLSNHEFGRLIQVCSSANLKTGTTYCGRKDYLKIAWINPKVFDNATDYLTRRGFITLRAKRGKVSYWKVNTFPIYDSTANITYPYPAKARTVFGLTNARIGFIKIPYTLREILIGNDILTKHEKLVLIKLYRYNFLAKFGGVDPNVYRKISNQPLIDETLYNDLLLSEAEFVIAVERLESLGLIKTVPVVVRHEPIDFEIVIRYISDYHPGFILSPTEEVATIIRPTHQFKNDIEEALLYQGGIHNGNTA